MFDIHARDNLYNFETFEKKNIKCTQNSIEFLLYFIVLLYIYVTLISLNFYIFYFAQH